jgi:hypothetical protein
MSKDESKSKPKKIRSARPRNLVGKPRDFGLYLKRIGNAYALYTDHDIKKNAVIAPYIYDMKNVVSYKLFRDEFGRDFRRTYTICIPYKPWKIINNKQTPNFIDFARDGSPKHNAVLRRYKLIARKDIKAHEEITLKYLNYEPLHKAT